MAKTKMKTHITIPVFYHEDEEGRVILDNQYMRDYFDNQLKLLYLETKLGREDASKNKFKEQLNK